MRFIEVEVSSWLDYSQVVSVLDGFAYRGQANASWVLSTALERSFHNQASSCSESFERHSLRDFRLKAHLYSSGMPPADNPFEWLAVMQHHGCPTRLLDFSFSPYVALYFSIIDASTDSAVWAINVPYIEEKERVEYRDWLRDAGKSLQPDSSSVEALNVHLCATGRNWSRLGLLALQTEMPTLRVVRQQGLFVAPKYLSRIKGGAVSFMESLADCLKMKPGSGPEGVLLSHLIDSDSPLSSIGCAKIVINKKLQIRARQELNKMGINAESLFPGLDGLGRAQRDSTWKFIQDISNLESQSLESNDEFNPTNSSGLRPPEFAG